MSELYTGPKFETVFQNHQPPNHFGIEQLKYWCKIFHEQGLTPSHESGTAGNLSFRINSGSNEFIITAAGLQAKCKLRDNDFVHVISCNITQRKVIVNGTKLPSSESMMHAVIYETLPDINSVFHGHYQALIDHAEILGLPITSTVCDYGTIELIESILPLLGQHSFFIIRQHGFLSLGTNMNIAGQQALFWKNELTERL